MAGSTAIADPPAGGAAVKTREPLANQELETERLQLIVDGTMQTPDARANGWGAQRHPRACRQPWMKRWRPSA